jgi:drug/metabolite transporter (DMT)-like permease
MPQDLPPEPTAPPVAGRAAPPRAGAGAGRPLKGIALMVGAMVTFASQDAVTKLLTGDYPVPQIVMVRYLAFAVFALVWAHLAGGLGRALRSGQPGWQVARSLLILAEIAIFAWVVHYLPLVDLHALMAVSPLMVTALAVVMLGERVGPRRWAAVLAGFVGVLVILRPGLGVMDPMAPLGLFGAFLFALYVVVTRRVGRTDSAETSMVAMAVIGALATLAWGPFVWVAPDARGWLMLGALSAASILAHVLLVLALQAAAASVLQPFQYTLLVWAAVIGFLVFGHVPDPWTVLGAGIVVSSGLYVIWRERKVKGGPAG